jgi:hypothetical protein
VKSREKTLTDGILFPVVGDKHTWWVKLMILVIAIFLDILDIYKYLEVISDKL